MSGSCGRKEDKTDSMSEVTRQPANRPEFTLVTMRTVDEQSLICDDCVAIMKCLSTASIDVVVTSPPYNRNVKYGAYLDARPKAEYLRWCSEWLTELRRVLKPDGSLFLNVGASPRQPDGPRDLLAIARQSGFVLQNEIIWVKSVYVPGAVRIDDVRKHLSNPNQAVDPKLIELLERGGHPFGHYRPVNSQRFLTPVHETVFHLTAGHTELDRLAIGVPYADPTNQARWNARCPRRCLGNVWFIPYETIRSAGPHPAGFPVELPRKCIQLHFGDERKGLVLDPFGGIGTTALAARMEGHRAISVELDPQYHNIAVARLRDDLKEKESIPA